MKRYEVQRAIEAAAHKLCAAFGRPPVTIHWEASVPTAAININGDLYLSGGLPDDNIPRAVFTRYVGFAVHELLHWCFTAFTVRAKGSYVAALHNAVEDAWIESRAIKSGLIGNGDGLLSALIDGMVQDALAAVSDWADPKQYPFALAVYCRPHASIKVPLAKGLEPVFAEAARRTALCTSSADTLAVAEWVFKQLNLQPQAGDNGQQGDKGKQQGQQQGDKGEGQPSDGKPGQSGEGQPGQSGEGKAGEGKAGEGKPAKAGEGKPGDAQDGEQADGAGKPGDKQGKAGDKQTGERQQVEARNAPVGVPVEPACPETGGNPHGGSYCGDDVTVHKLDDLSSRQPAFPLDCDSGKLRREVRKLLENSASVEYDRGRKAGRVDVRALHKTAHSDNVFQRRSERDGIDSAVSILLDVSGSMAKRIGTAVPVAAALYAAAKAAQASARLSTFRHDLHAGKWDAPVAQVNHLLQRVWTAGGTNDYVALRWASEDLLQRREQRKVLINITDGGGDAKSCREWVESLGRLGVVVIGVGVQTRVSHIYEHSVLVSDLASLGQLTFGAVIKALR